jgi:hypothetical protein
MRGHRMYAAGLTPLAAEVLLERLEAELDLPPGATQLDDLRDRQA